MSKPITESTKIITSKLRNGFLDCKNESMDYAQCVLKNIDDVKYQSCNIEFEKFKNCVNKSIAKSRAR